MLLAALWSLAQSLLIEVGGWVSGENAMAHAAGRLRVVRSVSQSVSIPKEGVLLWSATTKEPSISALDKNIDADVCIVGAGIAGMTTAYTLAREGKSVVVLDKVQIGSGETAYTTAHLSNVIDSAYREIEHLHGAKGARLVAQSHTAAIAQIESIVVHSPETGRGGSLADV